MRPRRAMMITLSAALSLSAAFATTAVRLPAATGGPTGTDVTVALTADTGGTDLSAAALRFTYDDAKFQLMGVYRTGFSSPMALTWSNVPNAGPDTVDVQLSGGPVSSPAGDHEVAWARFRVLGGSGSALTWDQAGTTINGVAADAFFDGSVTPNAATVGFSVSDTANGAPAPSPTATRSVDIVVAPPAGLLSFDVTMEFDPAVVAADGVVTTAATSGWELTANTSTAGKVLISLFHSDPLTGTAPTAIATVQLHVTGAPGDATPLAITRYVTNDGVSTYRDDGLYTLSSDADADGWTVLDGDCNDAAAAINPAASEICDPGNVDENCNGLADDADPGAAGQTLWYADADTDGFGNAAVSLSKCDQPVGYVADATDCDDAHATVHPGAPELCDGLDNNCDTATAATEIDDDGDTYVECSPWVGAAGIYGGDCNDADPLIHPGAAERCNGIADACGTVPANETDGDGDHYVACSPWTGAVGTYGGDCNDANAAVNPGVAEICGNAIDDNCDTLVDNVTGTRYVATGGTNGTNACIDSGAPCLTIQHAIDVACPAETVEVAAGTFTENLRVPKALAVHGAGQGSTIVIPANSVPNPCSGSSLCGSATAATNLFLIEASNVTVSDMTFDGDNPALTSGIVRNGADLDARNGIVENYYPAVPFGNTAVHDVTVKNVYLRGIYMSSGGSGFNVHHATVQNVQGDGNSIAMFNWVGSGTFADNAVDKANDAISANHSSGTSFLRNVVTNSSSGVHTDNAGDGGGTADVIDGNQVSSCTSGGYGVWVFVPYIAPSVRNNTVSGCDVGLGMYAGSFTGVPVDTAFDTNTVNGQGACTVAFQILTTTWYYGPGNTRATLTDNTLTGCTTGVEVGEDSQTQTPPANNSKDVTLTGTGNDITANGVGVTIDADVDAGSAVNLSGNKIYGNATSGFDNTGAIAPPDVLAECTWWGSDAGPVAPNNLATGEVDTSPWAANASLTPLDYYVDGDADGYGDAAGAPVSQCGPPFPGRVADHSDCNDAASVVHPGAYEFCDLVDNNCDGNLNDAQADANCDDGNSCDAERCSVGGACYYDSFSCSLAGNVYYYRDSTDPDGIEDSSTKGVPGVVFDMTGFASGTTTSANPDGAFAFTAGGNETLAPRAKIGDFVKPDDPATPVNEVYQNGVSSLDATRIAQYAVGLRPLTPDQTLAGDASNNGSVTSYDASLVAQYQVGLIARFPVAIAHGSDWVFVPASKDVSVVGADLLGQDFAGILYGDVTANWGELSTGFAGASNEPVLGEADAGDRLLRTLAAQAPREIRSAAPEAGGTAALEGPIARPAGPAGAVVYVASRPVLLPNGDMRVVLGIQNADGIVAMDLHLDFDPAVATVRSVANVGLASNLVLTQNGRRGDYAVSLFGVSGMQGTGPFLEVTFRAASNRSTVPFRATAEANEGQIPLTFERDLLLSGDGQ